LTKKQSKLCKWFLPGFPVANPLRYLIALTVILSPQLSIFSQTPSPTARQGDQKIRISTSEVLLDVLVRDRKGNPVTDLTSEEFEVFEDGVKQSLTSFKLVTRRPGSKLKKTDGGESAIDHPTKTIPALTPVERRPDPEVGVNVVALVFDRLSQDARKRAHDAALTYLVEGNELASFVGVFAINLSLNTVQNYTTDINLVKKGIEKAGILAASSFDNATPLRNSQKQETGTANPTSQPAGGEGAGAAAAALAGVDQQFEIMKARAEETFEVLQRDQQGYATTNGLLAVVNSMQRLPGRKAVIFFSEGMALPPNVQQHFRSVINAANRANTSVYAVDAAGLRTESPLKETRDEISARSKQRMDNLHLAMRTPDALTKGLERNEDLLNLNPQNGLVQLASETGGIFIGDTNKIGDRLKQVDEELNTYYLMTYSPANPNYDGKFRSISVKVKRPGVDLVTRKGYLSVPPIGDSPLFYYEAVPLAALNRSTRPNDFPILTASLNFPEANRLGRTAIEVEAPADAFTFSADHEKKVYTTDFSIVVLVKDQSKQVVDKLSHHYVLLGPVDSINSAKKGKILFYRETNLPPGKYDVEAIAYDALSNKASVNKSMIEIPASDRSRLRLSSVAIIQRAEQVKEKTESPFLIGEVLVYPNLGEPVRKSANKQLGFYFNIYPANNDLPQLLLEVLQGSKSIAKLPLKLAPADARGRIQFASALPLDSLGPGSYELKITVSDTKESVSRSTIFTLEP
jgi:VWFA-related protein